MAELRDNPIQTDGFEFVEYAASDPRALGELFERMGFQAVARHRHKDVLLYKQGDVNFIVNAEPRSFAQNFARRHGPSVCAMAFRVKDAATAYDRLLERGAWGVESRPGPGELSIPAIKGIGDSLIYLVDRYPENDYGNTIYDVDFKPLPGFEAFWRGDEPGPAGAGLRYVDHLTHNVHRGRMKEWAEFYERLFDTPDTYYEMVGKRLPNHGEPLEELQRRRILIDGSPSGGRLLQIFTKTAIGPIFFEIIQRKGDEVFGEGNFKALFESMELDQVRRGVLKPAA